MRRSAHPAFVTCLIALWAAQSVPAGAAADLSDSDKEQFLLTAKVVSRKTLSVGITGSQRAVLDDGRLRHDAHVQDVDEFKPIHQTAAGAEINFRDYYGFNIAAYRLDRLLGLNMVPTSVERKVGGNSSSVTWWVDDVLMMEKDRYLKKIDPPDQKAWNDQMYNVRVFNELVYNTDANLGNVLIDRDWNLHLVDFTRAFRTYKSVRDSDNLVRIDPGILAGLKALDLETLTGRMGKLLRKSEIEGILARRDEIVAFFERKIAAEGEDAAYARLPGR